MRILLALGGNALIQRGQPLDQEVQLENITHASKMIKNMTKRAQLIVCHGNGPQIGLLSLMSHAYKEVASYSLDVLVAESQGMIGYMLQNGLYASGITSAAALLTRVIVDPHDPAFKTPTKQIGPVYDKETAFALAKEKGWDVAKDGKFYRRVVPSPEPKEIVEVESARRLIEAGYIVIMCGGGGIPVVRNGKHLKGIEAVIDKDRASAVAAIQLGCDRLVILTDVDAVYENWQMSDERAIRAFSPTHAATMTFAKGSMWPKVHAACHFAQVTGNVAIIGNMMQAETMLKGESGTHIAKDVKEICYYS